jgi:membrane-bound ClpP family serine protease
LLVALVPDGGLSFVLWWEWVTLRPLASRPTPGSRTPEHKYETVPLNAAGQATTSLRPTGKVSIDGVAYEARSEGGWVDAGAVVLVVGSDAHGLIVREHRPEEA